jgi:hypothetical protein
MAQSPPNLSSFTNNSRTWMDFFSLLERLSQVMMLTNAVDIGCPNLIAQSKRDVKTIALSIGALLTLLGLYERKYLVLDDGFS